MALPATPATAAKNQNPPGRATSGYEPERPPRRPSRRAKALANLWKYRYLTLMMVPAILVLAVHSYLPMFGVFIAFKNVNYVDGIWGSPWAGFDNFQFLFDSGSLWRITRNTIGYSLAFLVINLVVSVGIAVALNEVRSRLLGRAYQTVILMPYFLSMVVVSYLVYAFLNPTQGFMNVTVLRWLGLDQVFWYSEKDYWPYILTLVNAWHGVGIGAVVYIAAIAGIDPEYYEAAVIDGASKWKRIKHITLPTIRPVMIILTILQIGKIFNSDFGLFYQVTMDAGALYPTTDVVDTYVYRSLLEMNDIGMSSAAAFMQSVLGLLLVVATNYAVRRIDREQALF